MKEYVVQYNNGKHSCGPIVLLNALRHQGHRAGRKHLPWIARRLKSTGNGVFVRDLDRVGRQMGAFKRLYRPSFTKIDHHLMRGNAVAFRIGLKQETDEGTRYMGHYLLLTAIWCHRGNVSYYTCNIGGKCKWMEFDDLDRFYSRLYDDWWITHTWLVPLKGKKLRLIA